MKKRIFALTVVGCLGIGTSNAWCQVGKMGVQLVKKTPTSALDVLGSRFSAGANIAKTQAALERAAKLAALRSWNVPNKNFIRTRQNFNTFILNPITPTSSSDLRLRLVSPSMKQGQEAVQKYEEFFADFKKVRTEINSVLGNSLLDGTDLQKTLHPSQRGYYAGKLQALEFRLNKLQNFLFPNDPALVQARKYIEFAASKFNEFYSPSVTVNKYVARPFVQDEFWMEYDWRQGPRDESLTLLPENVHMAVLNDSYDILNMYRQWERTGRFPKGWKVSVYDDARKLLDAISAGENFDLIISDINVPGGGGRYFVGQLREMGSNAPVIGCSMYRRDKIDSKELHKIGFDGYMYGDDMFEESAGFWKWAGYVKNYYYYKRIGNWPR